MIATKRVKDYESKELEWTFDLPNKAHVIKVGSIIQLVNGQMFEVAYVENDFIYTTQNRRYHIESVEVVLSPEQLSEIEEVLGPLSLAPITSDPVNHPSHYTQGKFETIEVIEEWTQHYSDGYVGYCAGNTLKYVSRAPHKHATPLEDLKKARAYLDFAIAYEEAKL